MGRTSGVAAAALLLLCCIPACRQTDAGGGGGEFRFAMSFSASSLYTYEMWSLDRLGVRVPGSNRSRYLYVEAVGVSAYGYDDVTLLVDTREGERADSVYVRCTPQGQVYQYGYVAGLVRQLQSKNIPARWDLLATFSGGPVSSWTVGWADSVGQSRIVGSTYGEEVLFDVEVNGVKTVVPAVRVYHYGETIDGTMWLSDNPTAIIQMRQQVYPPISTRSGEVSDIVKMELR